MISEEEQCLCVLKYRSLEVIAALTSKSFYLCRLVYSSINKDFSILNWKWPSFRIMFHSTLLRIWKNFKFVHVNTVNCFTYFCFWIWNSLRIRIESFQFKRSAPQKGENFGEGSSMVSTEHFVNTRRRKGSHYVKYLSLLCYINRTGTFQSLYQVYLTIYNTKWQKYFDRLGCWKIPVRLIRHTSIKVSLLY